MDSERPSDTYDDDEIDLRRYVAILFRRWRLIVTLAALAVMAAGLVALTSAPPYEAVAGVAIVKSRTELVFDPKFVTVTGDTGTTVAASSDAQRNALLGLVQMAPSLPRWWRNWGANWSRASVTRVCGSPESRVNWCRKET